MCLAAELSAARINPEGNMLRQAYRFVILVVGMTVLFVGIALVVLPGPAFIVIPLGLGILATEFAWARRWLRVVRASADKGAKRLNFRFPLFRTKSE